MPADLDAIHHPLRRVCQFVHIPKTGGVSIERILEGWFGTEAVCPYYWPREFFEAADAPLDRFRVFAGHSPFGLLGALPEPVTTFTILRQPINRTLSAFKHIMRDPYHDEHRLAMEEAPSLVAFVTHPRLRWHVWDGQTRLIGSDLDLGDLRRQVAAGSLTAEDATGACTEALEVPVTEAAFERACRRLEQMLAIGLTEHMGQFVHLLSRLLGMPRPETVPTLNTAPDDQLPTCESLTEEELLAVHRATHWDLQLYEFASGLLGID